ncbi:MAG: aspartate/glutamate racemase family protein [Oscillospiraceae bacterium]|nr:aspartate/glutamate racemase family protein [Oscillospiraceae bacterium]
MAEKVTLGVIGGLGPIATAHFMELIIRMTKADTDQEHLDMIIYNRPSIPDRTGYILDSTKPNPLPEMIRVGNALARQGAKLIAIPCMTAHYFHRELTRYIETPIVHAIHEVAAHLKKHGITRVGIMATDGSIRSGLFQQELQKHGIEPIIPGDQAQKCVMSVIYDDVKANKPAEMDKFRFASGELREKGAQAIILGCTELSLVKRDYAIGAGYLDAMEVLAQTCVLRCGGKLKEEYQELISK